MKKYLTAFAMPFPRCYFLQMLRNGCSFPSSNFDAAMVDFKSPLVNAYLIPDVWNNRRDSLAGTSPIDPYKTFTMQIISIMLFIQSLVNYKTKIQKLSLTTERKVRSENIDKSVWYLTC